MVNKEELKNENIYYRVTYHDDLLNYPKIKTYVFIGKNITDDKFFGGYKDEYYLQNIESYLKNGAFSDSNDVGGEVLVLEEESLIDVFDLKGLIENLMIVAKRQAKR